MLCVVAMLLLRCWSPLQSICNTGPSAALLQDTSRAGVGPERMEYVALVMREKDLKASCCLCWLHA